MCIFLNIERTFDNTFYQAVSDAKKRESGHHSFQMDKIIAPDSKHLFKQHADEVANKATYSSYSETWPGNSEDVTLTRSGGFIVR